jgi:hypothetical protein
MRALGGASVLAKESEVALAGDVGILFSCVTLYPTYCPYWYMVRGVIRSGGNSSPLDLRDFLETTQTPSIASPHWLARFFTPVHPVFLFYFWAGVTLLGLIGLVLILLRHLFGRLPNGETHTRRF